MGGTVRCHARSCGSFAATCFSEPREATIPARGRGGDSGGLWERIRQGPWHPGFLAARPFTGPHTLPKDQASRVSRDRFLCLPTAFLRVLLRNGGRPRVWKVGDRTTGAVGGCRRLVLATTCGKKSKPRDNVVHRSSAGVGPRESGPQLMSSCLLRRRKSPVVRVHLWGTTFCAGLSPQTCRSSRLRHLGDTVAVLRQRRKGFNSPRKPRMAGREKKTGTRNRQQRKQKQEKPSKKELLKSSIQPNCKTTTRNQQKQQQSTYQITTLSDHDDGAG